MLETFTHADGVYMVLANSQGLVLGVRGGVQPLGKNLMFIHYKFLVLRDSKSKIQIPKTGALGLAMTFPGLPLLIQENKEIALIGGVVAQPDDKKILFTKEYRRVIVTIVVGFIMELVTKALTVDRDKVVSGLALLFDNILTPQSNIISVEKSDAPKDTSKGE